MHADFGREDCIPALDRKNVDSPYVESLIIGHSRDSPHDGCQERKCGDCQETDKAWSQCEAYQQGELNCVQ